MSTIFAAVDLSTVVTALTPIGVAVIGIALIYKGVTLAKRALKAA